MVQADPARADARPATRCEAGRPHVATPRLRRTIAVERLLLDQLEVLETMSPEGFLEFRDPLAPASGFQSRQFREIEWLSGGAGHLARAAATRRRARRSTRRSRAGLGLPEDREERLAALADLYRDHAGDPLRAAWHEVAELLLDHDEGVGRWRHHHVADGRARDRHAAGHGRLARRRVPAHDRRPALLPRAVGRPARAVSTILITGATDGLGRALAERAVAEGWDVLAHGRSAEKLRRPRGRAARSGPTSPRSTRSRRSPTAVEGATDRLDVLVSNAGIGIARAAREVSADGHELRFAVNYLAGYALIRRLLPLLQRVRARRGSSRSPRPGRRRSTSAT